MMSKRRADAYVVDAAEATLDVLVCAGFVSGNLHIRAYCRE